MKHKPIWEENLSQAYGCASVVIRDGIRGFYGSRVADGHYYVWKNDLAPDHILRVIKWHDNKKELIICDACILRLKDADEIVCTKSGLYWE